MISMEQEREVQDSAVKLLQSATHPQHQVGAGDPPVERLQPS